MLVHVYPAVCVCVCVHASLYVHECILESLRVFMSVCGSLPRLSVHACLLLPVL